MTDIPVLPFELRPNIGLSITRKHPSRIIWPCLSSHCRFLTWPFCESHASSTIVLLALSTCSLRAATGQADHLLFCPASERPDSNRYSAASFDAAASPIELRSDVHRIPKGASYFSECLTIGFSGFSLCRLSGYLKEEDSFYRSIRLTPREYISSVSGST